MNRKHLHCFVLVSCLLLLCLCGTLRAQSAAPAGSFADLQGRLVPGMDVTAVDHSGRKLSGQVAEITSTVLVIENNGDKVTYSPATLAEVRQRKHDSLLNGALIGAAVGAGAMIVPVAAFCESGDECGPTYAAYAALGGGVGAGIGILLDSLFQKQVVTYRSVQMSLSVSPAKHTHSPGLGVSLRW